MLKRIKNLLFRLRIYVKQQFTHFSVYLKARNPKYTNIYFGTPIYGNLGDQQIGASAKEFFKYHKIKTIFIYSHNYYLLQNMKFNYVKTICLPGGGNLGDVYLDDVILRDYVVRYFTDKKIIIFPQTFYCHDTSENGQIEITKRIFAKHPSLVITAREQQSFEILNKTFNNKIILTPDTVLFSNYTSKCNTKRRNVLKLLRSDLEQNINKGTLDQFDQQFAKHGKILMSDTIVDKWPYDIGVTKLLKKLFKKITKAKFVVTDRLHGMIFCAITNTPCIVLSNYNHKIKSSYETWLKHLDYIHFAEDVNSLDVEKVIEKITNAKTKWEPLIDKFEPLVAEIKNENNNN